MGWNPAPTGCAHLQGFRSCRESVSGILQLAEAIAGAESATGLAGPTKSEPGAWSTWDRIPEKTTGPGAATRPARNHAWGL